MNSTAQSFPTISVYRTHDGGWYRFMELAEVDAGHRVAWGSLVEMTREEVALKGRDFVIRSLAEFRNRDANDKSKRLNMRGKEPLHLHHDLVTVRLVSPSSIEIIPERRVGPQYDSLENAKLTIGADTSGRDFISALDNAFNAARGLV